MSRLVVLTTVLPAYDKDNNIVLSAADQQRDALDEYNHSRQRRARLLQELQLRSSAEIRQCDPSQEDLSDIFTQVYSPVHTEGLLHFLQTASDQWTAEQQDDSCAKLIPIATPLMRTNQQQQQQQQKPSQHVLGQMGYYCTDTCTPMFAGIREELEHDAYLVHQALTLLEAAQQNTLFLLPTHPGHHAAADCFGGYCYTNHAAAVAAGILVQKHRAVAILDVDYHCGNGTAAIFDNNPDVLVVSLHCDPNFDYPFHDGFADDTGSAGTTCHLPLPPGTDWSTYEPALQLALKRICEFGATACIVSLGLDTYEHDPCALRRAGFRLKDDDYTAMGKCIARGLASNVVQVVFVQEGGYRMDKVAVAAADVVCGFVTERQKCCEFKEE